MLLLTLYYGDELGLENGLVTHDRLLHLRHQTPALMGGSYQPLVTGDAHCFVYRREHRTGSYLIALNFSSQPRRLAIPGASSGNLLLSTHLDRTGPIGLEEPLEPRSDEG